MKKCTRIYLEYSDDTAEEATGDDAAKLWEFIESSAALCQARSGIIYRGPYLKPYEG